MKELVGNCLGQIVGIKRDREKKVIYIERKIHTGRKIHIEKKIHTVRKIHIERKIHTGRKIYLERKIQSGRKIHTERRGKSDIQDLHRRLHPLPHQIDSKIRLEMNTEKNMV